MTDQPGLSDQYSRASPWPLFVAVGIALSETGIILPLLPLAVGGLLLFTGSVAGILTEAGYLAHPWRFISLVGGILLTIGIGLSIIGSGTVAYRGQALILTGLICVPASILTVKSELFN